MAEKLFYSMGEVSEMFDVNASLIRHWESQFSIIRPKRNKKGNRLFTPEDVENLKLIYHMVKEQGMTLEGAGKALRKRRGDSGVTRDMELLERLQRVRSLLEEVREELRDDQGGVIVAHDTSNAVVSPQTEHTPVRRTKVVVKIDADVAVSEDDAPEGDEKHVRRPRRKKNEAEEKELFAFYEQSLF